MAYTELIKSFNRIRDYMREFYVYGFKSRDEYTRKSGRSYDDERRRLESWLGDYMQFRQTKDGKNVFLSIDSRMTRHNPLYKAWKTKSFTDGEITLHFILMDILAVSEKSMSLSDITGKIDEYLSSFAEPRVFDTSTVRKKLNEYVSEGILTTEKQGKTLYYKRTEEFSGCDADILNYFSEVSPCGVIGSFLLDKLEKEEREKDCFVFKHHYINSAMDSEIVCRMFQAMQEKRSITIGIQNRYKACASKKQIIPLRLMISVQSGRQYLMAYIPETRRIKPFRTDSIVSVTLGEESDCFDEMRKKLDDMKSHIWGVSTQSRFDSRMEWVEFTIHYEDDEQYIHQRLEREKRCGMVERIDAHTSRFYMEVYDASELIPWIRTFICRITEIHFSNPEMEYQFKKDMEEMYRLYGLEGGEEV